MQILNGAEGIKQAYEMTLSTDKIDFVCFSTKYDDILGGYFDRHYSPRLTKSQIKTREILPDTETNRKAALKKNEKNQVKFINNLKSESDMILFDNKVILISYNNDVPYAVVMADPDLVANFKSQFNALWGSV